MVTGKEAQKGGGIGIPMVIRGDVRQKLTQYCKTIILQLKM